MGGVSEGVCVCVWLSLCVFLFFSSGCYVIVRENKFCKA